MINLLSKAFLRSKLLLSTRLLSVVVAVVDTGIDIQNAHLQEALWQNPNEQLNGRDDDGNGFVDDIHGWDFTRNLPLPQDTHGHGTHVASIIHRTSPETKLMILKYYDSQVGAQQNVQNTVKAIRYATQMNAQIINYSAGGSNANADESSAIEQALANNILLVAAAGNEGANTDIEAFYPASYSFLNIISVAATDSRARLLPSSNYGAKSVDVAAPGDSIEGLLPGNRIAKMTGTSQAAAYISGAAANMIAEQKGPYSFHTIRNALLKTNKAPFTSLTP